MKLLHVVLFLCLLTYANAQMLPHSDGIIKDTKTNLLWQDTKDVKNTKRTYHNALEYCKNLEIDGQKGWSVPGFVELFSIVNTKLYNPTLDKTFKYFVSDNYWTSKTFGHGKTSEAFVIDFKSGAFNRKMMDEKFFVRCYKKNL